MRLQTKKGYEKSGVVKKPAAEQGSYVVQTGVKEDLRNRKHILAVPEPAPAQSPAAAPSPTLLATALQQPPTLSNAPHQSPTMSNEDIFPEFAIPAKTPSEPIRRHRQGSLSDPKLHYSLLLKAVRRRSLVQTVLHTLMPKDRKLSQDLEESHDLIRNPRSL